MAKKRWPWERVGRHVCLILTGNWTGATKHQSSSPGPPVRFSDIVLYHNRQLRSSRLLKLVFSLSSGYFSALYLESSSRGCRYCLFKLQQISLSPLRRWKRCYIAHCFGRKLFVVYLHVTHSEQNRTAAFLLIWSIKPWGLDCSSGFYFGRTTPWRSERR